MTLDDVPDGWPPRPAGHLRLFGSIEDSDASGDTGGYRGRRRASEPPREPEPATSPPRVVAAVVVLALFAAVVASLAWRSSRSDERGTPAAARPAPALPAASADGSSTGEPQAPPSTTPSKNSPSPSHSTRPPFKPLSVEAEASANQLDGTARVTSYPGASNGQIVRGIGDWGPGRKPVGTLRIDGVTVPATGTYQLTFWYVNLDDQQTLTAVITVGSRTVTVTTVGGSTCCASKAITVTLQKGANSIVFANADNRAPAIDKIMIS
jgi:hypothetical protein